MTDQDVDDDSTSEPPRQIRRLNEDGEETVYHRRMPTRSTNWRLRGEALTGRDMRLLRCTTEWMDGLIVLIAALLQSLCDLPSLLQGHGAVAPNLSAMVTALSQLLSSMATALSDVWWSCLELYDDIIWSDALLP